MFKLGQDWLTCETLFALSNHSLAAQKNISLEPSARKKISEYRSLVDKVTVSGETHYGINTGFGYLSDVRIQSNQLVELQYNLIRSHACGVGPLADLRHVRALMILRAHTFALGHTGISLDCVDLLLSLLKADALPAIPTQGSVGACGDLAPLAHLAMGLIGEGQLHFEGSWQNAKDVLGQLQLNPHELQPKEGLSLINGTHFMTAIAAYCVSEARLLALIADIATALSLDAIRGTITAFDPRIQDVRHHPGQKRVAQNLRLMFERHDPIQESHKDCSKVQDPYSFRCAPQVHGAARDTIEFVASTIDRELNAVTDNPLVFEDGSILSGGNFHGEPVAMAMDFLAIAVSELGSISERRIEKLTNPNMSDLPAFLVKDSGVSSGFMIPHVVSAALASENKTLCHPASVDSIPTSADKEDHVSMGPIAAMKALRVLKNTSKILAVELLAACQGIDLLQPLEPNDCLGAVYKEVRTLSPRLDKDRSLHTDIEMLSEWLLSGKIKEVVKVSGYEIS